MPESLAIRFASEAEMGILVDWAAAEGWNPGLNDVKCFYATDPQGFLLGELAGQPVGCISAVRYGDSFGFLGFYIVHPDWRGRGYGLQLWQAAMKHLEHRNVGLDGVVAQQENYKKSGFTLAYRNIRYGGKAQGISSGSSELLPLSEVPFDAVVDYDASLFSLSRPSFLQQWIKPPGGAAFGLVREGRLAGYGVIRACQSGYKIGPLFAEEESGAEALFLGLTNKFSGETVYLDVPAVNPAGMALAEQYGMTPVFETARMYTGAPLQVDLGKVFGVTSFELG